MNMVVTTGSDEVWRPIAGALGYEISNLGRVKSLARTVQRRSRWGGVSSHTVRERVLKPGRRSGYPLFAVHVGDRQLTLYIHEQVMAAFGTTKPFPKAMIRHLDDNTSNCRIDNLEWGTQQQNMADAKRNGHQLGGYRPKGFRSADWR